MMSRSWEWPGDEATRLYSICLSSEFLVIVQVQGGMPKLHPLSHDTSVQQKTTPSLPPQPVLSKPFVPAPPPLSTGTSTPAAAPPPSMPTLHKIMTATPTAHQQQQPPQLQPQHKTTPTVCGAPPLKPNPNIVMPKLTTSLGQVKPSTTGLPVLSRAPIPLPMQPPPPPKPHPQADISSTSSSSGVSGGSSAVISSALPRPPVQAEIPKSSAAVKSKSHKQSGSAGKSGKSHSSSSKKKKK